MIFFYLDLWFKRLEFSKSYRIPTKWFIACRREFRKRSNLLKNLAESNSHPILMFFLWPNLTIIHIFLLSFSIFCFTLTFLSESYVLLILLFFYLYDSKDTGRMYTGKRLNNSEQRATEASSRQHSSSNLSTVHSTLASPTTTTTTTTHFAHLISLLPSYRNPNPPHPGSCPAAPHVAAPRARLHRPLASAAAALLLLRRRRPRGRRRPEGHRAPPRPPWLRVAGPPPCGYCRCRCHCHHPWAAARQGCQARVPRRGRADAAHCRRREGQGGEGGGGGGGWGGGQEGRRAAAAGCEVGALCSCGFRRFFMCFFLVPCRVLGGGGGGGGCCLAAGRCGWSANGWWVWRIFFPYIKRFFFCGGFS